MELKKKLLTLSASSWTGSTATRREVGSFECTARRRKSFSLVSSVVSSKTFCDKFCRLLPLSSHSPREGLKIFPSSPEFSLFSLPTFTFSQVWIFFSSCKSLSLHRVSVRKKLFRQMCIRRRVQSGKFIIARWDTRKKGKKQLIRVSRLIEIRPRSLSIKTLLAPRASLL